MARMSTAVAVLILSAALFGSALGQAPSPTSMSAPRLAPSPMFVPSPESSFGPAPPPGPDCFTILLNLSDCLTYVQPGSNLTVPDKPCCPELKNLVDSSPVCLCKLLGEPESTGFNISVSRALKLPSVCAVATPPVSLCSVFGIPVAAPMASEGPSAPGGEPPSSIASAPSGSKSRASRSVLSGGVFGAAILVSMFF
ncbi:non-specific lipid transfer protein GPI-anchored 2 [Punica granatum]|uniref:Non-specific lipid transfer protein GPI-anchored 2 n=2 Tax=Punica granatum TaxID=22663 RepID=A0A6P8D1L0_PUNGR|nr:non-specific lipid transfer protein GPI-anchored 2 [Punica granatum]PKI40299.1 hypothetical protein CRG98_039324 [Punica granatum]